MSGNGELAHQGFAYVNFFVVIANVEYEHLWSFDVDANRRSTDFNAIAQFCFSSEYVQNFLFARPG